MARNEARYDRGTRVFAVYRIPYSDRLVADLATKQTAIGSSASTRSFIYWVADASSRAFVIVDVATTG